MSSGLFVLTHGLGAVQGLFLALVLAGGRRDSLPNRFLAAVMLAFSVDLGMAVYHATGLDGRFPHLIGLDFPLALLYGPLLYLYARTLSERVRTFRRAYLWHFVPFVLLVVVMLPLYVQPGAAKLAFLQAPSASGWPAILGIINHAKLLHALAYIVAILSLLRVHRRRLQDTLSSSDRINLVWLRNLLYGIIALTLLAVVLYVLSLRGGSTVLGLDPDSTYDDYMLLGLAVFVYAIGYLGLRQPEIFDAQSHGRRTEATGPDTQPHAATEDMDVPTAPKPQYARSGMDAAAAAHYEQVLSALMEHEKPYQRGDLTLHDLADASGISPHHLTEVINTRIGQNFYDFVNGYRVREVQQRLTDPESAHLTLLAIGLEAGFNSKSSFNFVFKKHTGMTPSAFRDRAIRTVRQ